MTRREEREKWLAEVAELELSGMTWRAEISPVMVFRRVTRDKEIDEILLQGGQVLGSVTSCGQVFLVLAIPAREIGGKSCSIGVARPGGPPRRQTGRLRSSIDLDGGYVQ